MRPKRCPSVRATFGRRSGPITISATTAMTMSSEKPMSNISSRLRRFLPRLAIDSLSGAWRNLRLGRVLFFASHAVLEAFHRASEIRAEIAQLLRSEDENHHQQHDQPM